MTKYQWSQRYVTDGDLKPDFHRRWARDCFVLVPFTALPEYQHFKRIYPKGMPIRIATMLQKDCLPNAVPDTADRFYVTMPRVHELANIGLTIQNVYGSDIYELQKEVEQRFDKLQLIFSSIVLNHEL